MLNTKAGPAFTQKHNIRPASSLVICPDSKRESVLRGPTGYPPIMLMSRTGAAQPGSRKRKRKGRSSSLPIAAAAPVWTVKTPNIIKGNREGISTCRQHSTPRPAPLAHSSGKMQSTAANRRAKRQAGRSRRFLWLAPVEEDVRRGFLALF